MRCERVRYLIFYSKSSGSETLFFSRDIFPLPCPSPFCGAVSPWWQSLETAPFYCPFVCERRHQQKREPKGLFCACWFVRQQTRFLSNASWTRSKNDFFCSEHIPTVCYAVVEFFSKHGTPYVLNMLSVYDSFEVNNTISKQHSWTISEALQHKQCTM